MCDVGSGGGGIDWSWRGGGCCNKNIGLGYSWMFYHVLPQKEGWGRRLSWSCCRAQWAATLDKQCVGTQRPQVYELPEKFLSWRVWAFVNAFSTLLPNTICIICRICLIDVRSFQFKIFCLTFHTKSTSVAKNLPDTAFHHSSPYGAETSDLPPCFINSKHGSRI